MLTEYRCRYCNALLFKFDKERVLELELEIKCHKGTCRRINVFEYALDKEPALA